MGLRGKGIAQDGRVISYGLEGRSRSGILDPVSLIFPPVPWYVSLPICLKSVEAEPSGLPELGGDWEQTGEGEY